jgi:hypothetical protein
MYRIFLIALYFILCASPVHAGIIELLSEKTKRSIGSLFGGAGSDVFEIKLKGMPANVEHSLVRVNIGLLTRTFICDLRKNKLRTCQLEGDVRVQQMFVRGDAQVKYQLMVKGYERNPDLHDLYFTVEKDRGFDRVVSFSATENSPLTFSYDDLPLGGENPLIAFYRFRNLNFVKLEISIREIDPMD